MVKIAKQNIENYFDIIHEKNSHLNALLSVSKDTNVQKGPLGAMAIAVKANICVKGMETNCASKVLEGFIAPYDATAIAKLRDAGALFVGMANCDEFACGSTGENSAFGPAQNPSAPGRISGGSSSGSAVAVAAGMCDTAIGSETGGSIRQPASHCGVIGYKPSYGFISRHGLIDLSMSLDAIGVFSRDVKTLSNVLNYARGADQYDARSVDFDFNISKDGLKGKRIGIVSQLRDLSSDKRIFDAVEKKTRQYAKACGAEIIEINLPFVERSVQTYYPLVYVEFFSGTRKFDGRKYGKKIEDFCGEEVLRRILGGKEISRAEFKGRFYRLALGMRSAITSGIRKAFDDVDFISMPVTPKLPHKLGERISPEDEYAYDAYTIPANLAGLCAASYPIGTLDNIPIGMQLMAARGDDAKLVGALSALEEVDHASG